MTLYLTEATDPADVAAAARGGLVTRGQALSRPGPPPIPRAACATSHGSCRCSKRMAEIGLPLCVHGEVTDPAVDIFDREAVFIDRVLAPLRASMPGLRVVMEHVTTGEGVAYVRARAAATWRATITVASPDPQPQPHPRRRHPAALLLPAGRQAREPPPRAASRPRPRGDPRFFLGTDSAPHPDTLKEAACGCAGCFTATNALSCLAAGVRGRGRARPAGGASRRCTARASTACRRTRRRMTLDRGAPRRLPGEDRRPAPAPSPCSIRVSPCTGASRTRMMLRQLLPRRRPRSPA